MSFEGMITGFVRSHPYSYQVTDEYPCWYFQHRNSQTIAGLPSRDESPALTRSMFSCHPHFDDLEATNAELNHHTGVFRTQIIHFAFSFEGLYFDPQVNEWFEKFEGLLRKLYWCDASARVLASGIEPVYEFYWQSHSDHLTDPERLYLPNQSWTRKHYKPTESASAEPTAKKRWFSRDS